jgi:hypothetical protein
MTYEKLLLQILDMTPEQRKQLVKVTDNTAWADESHKPVQEVWVTCWNPNDLYLVV